MPEIRLSGVQKPCSLRTGNMGKKTRAARSQTREKPSCRKILTLCKVPERGAPKPLPKQRGRAGPGRPDARRNKGRRTSCGRRSARPRRRKRPRTCGTWCCRFRRCTQGRESAENRRRAAFFRGTATLPMPRGRKKKRADAGVLQRRPHSARKSPPGREWTPGAQILPRRTSPREVPENARPRGAGPPAPARKIPPPRLRGAPLPVRPGAEADRPCPETRRNARRKAPERGTKKSGRTPPPATESGRAPSVKTTQMRTT